MKRTVTNFGYHALHTFWTCPRKYYWNYVEGIESKSQSSALAVGILAHAMLAHVLHPDTWWDWPGAWAVARKDLASRAIQYENIGPDVAFIEQELKRIFNVYEATYHGDEEKLGKTLAIELPFSYEIAPGISMTGRIDRLTLLESGAYLEDHKTYGMQSTRAKKLKEFRIDKQITGYMKGADVMGFKLVGAILSSLRKLPKNIEVFRDVQLRSPDEIHATVAQAGSTIVTIRRAAQMLEASGDLDLAYPQNTMSCFQKFPCPYYELCCYGDSARQAYYQEVEDGNVP